jgi:hypothetical protein
MQLCRFSTIFIANHYMQKIILLVAVLCLSVAGISQKENSLIITPGVGIGNLKLGMSEKQALAILKSEVNWTGYKEQLKSFASDGTNIDSVIQFVIGFDSCATFSQNPENMPVFSLYFNKHRLNFITVSSYTATEEQIEKVKLSNGLALYTPMEECVAKLGDEYSPVIYGDYDGDYYYYKLGIEVVFDEGRLTSIGIFPSTPNFKTLITQKSELLKKQVAEVMAGEEE